MRFSSLTMIAGLAFGLGAACSSSPAGSTNHGTGGGGTTSTHAASTSSGSSTSSSSGGTGQCHAQADCASGYFCGVTIIPPFCGGQCDNGGTGMCKTDAECQDAGVDFICGLPCECSHGGFQPQPHCTKGCTSNADCGPSMVCDATHRCQAAPCAQASDCTANFTCDATSKTCAPKPCTKDSDCSGFCVTGSCSPVIGSCAAEVP